MPLYIRDDEVDALAVRLQDITKAPSKTAAVKAALRNELERIRSEASIFERLAPIQAEARKLGPSLADFDMKRFMDELSGEV